MPSYIQRNLLIYFKNDLVLLLTGLQMLHLTHKHAVSVSNGVTGEAGLCFSRGCGDDVLFDFASSFSQDAEKRALNTAAFKPVLLLIADDQMLRETRHMVLERANFTVFSARSYDTLPEALVRRTDAVIFCHSVPLGWAEMLIEWLILVKPDVLIRRIVLWFEPNKCSVSEITVNGPADLIRKIQQLPVFGAPPDAQPNLSSSLR